MKKLYLKFKELDFTKRIVICFITVSLLFVVGLTTYKTTNGLYNNNQASQTQKKEDKNKTANKEESTQPTNDVSQETSSNQIQQDSQEITSNQASTQSAPQSSSNKQENKTQEKSSTVQNQTQTTPKQDTSSVQETTPKCNVSITIKGYQGKIMASQSVNLEEGSSVYNALKEVCLQKGMSVKGSSSYIKGIGGVCEFDHGSGSGWMYYVNGIQPNKSCGSYILINGDQVVWEYVNYE